MQKAEELLRRLALNDERTLRAVLSGDAAPAGRHALDGKTRTLVALGALLATSAGTTSLKWMTDAAYDAGATDEEIIGVLVAVAPEIGLPGIVRQAPRLALAIGYDVDDVAG